MQWHHTLLVSKQLFVASPMMSLFFQYPGFSYQREVHPFLRSYDIIVHCGSNWTGPHYQVLPCWIVCPPHYHTWRGTYFLISIEKVCFQCTFHKTRLFQTQGGLPPSWWYFSLYCIRNGQTDHVRRGCPSLVPYSLWHSQWNGYPAAATMDWLHFLIFGPYSLC